MQERMAQAEPGIREEQPVPQSKPSDPFVSRAISIINENISNSEFGKEEFAAAMNVSSSLLYKKIKTLTDQSPSDFIKTVRMNHALKLLQSGQYTVTEVSELSGFSSLSISAAPSKAISAKHQPKSKKSLKNKAGDHYAGLFYLKCKMKYLK